MHIPFVAVVGAMVGFLVGAVHVRKNKQSEIRSVFLFCFPCAVMSCRYRDRVVVGTRIG